MGFWERLGADMAVAESDTLEKRNRYQTRLCVLWLLKLALSMPSMGKSVPFYWAPTSYFGPSAPNHLV
jgi:hypothetical protein